MGGALLAGWLRDGLPPSVVIDPAPAVTVPSPHRVVASIDALPPGFAPAVLVLAIKPQVAASMLRALGARYPNALLLSIMAGRTIASMRRDSGIGAIVRAMPNIAASVGHGISGAVATPSALASRPLATRLLEAGGPVVWLEDEKLLDAVTAVSGSGPAYVFLLAELLERAGVAAGLPNDIARRLARATLTGAGRMLEADSRDARLMREAVTSPAGTTERALAVLMRDEAWPALVEQAVAAAASRSRELAS